MVLRPTRQTFLDIDASYDVHDGSGSFPERFRAFSARLGARDDAGNALSLETHYRRDETDYLSGEVDMAWLKPVYVSYKQRYHLGQSRTLENVASVEFRSQCWSVFFTYRDRLEDEEYYVTFSLTGVGNVGGFGGSLGEEAP